MRTQDVQQSLGLEKRHVLESRSFQMVQAGFQPSTAWNQNCSYEKDEALNIDGFQARQSLA